MTASWAGLGFSSAARSPPLRMTSLTSCSARFWASWLANSALVMPGWPGTWSGRANDDGLRDSARVLMLLPGPCW